MMRLLERSIRRLLGRGRRRHFFAPPPARTIRKLFDRHPILMNAMCYGTLCASAEISQQTIKYYVTKSSTAPKALNSNSVKSSDKHVIKYDLNSVKRLALWGTLVIPPIYHNWYKWLERRFPPCSMTGTITKQVILKKTFFDQFIFTPPILVLFFGTMAALEFVGKDKDSMWSKIKEEVMVKCPPVYLADCAFWIPVQAFNFAFVPPTWRVLYIGAMSFVWLNVLCFARSISTTEPTD